MGSSGGQSGKVSRISFQCACGRSLATPRQNAGKKCKCPACGHPVIVPGVPAEFVVRRAHPTQMDSDEIASIQVRIPQALLVKEPSRGKAKATFIWSSLGLIVFSFICTSWYLATRKDPSHAVAERHVADPKLVPSKHPPESQGVATESAVAGQPSPSSDESHSPQDRGTIGTSPQLATEGAKAPDFLGLATFAARNLFSAADRASALCRIANLYSEAKQKKKATDVIEEALTQARSIQEESEKGDVMSDIGGAFIRVQARTRASQAFRECADLMRTSSKSSLALHLAEVTSEVGLEEVALSVAEFLKATGDSSRHARALSRIAIDQAGRGDLPAARRTARSIGTDSTLEVTHYCRASALASVAVLDLKSGNPDSASSLFAEASEAAGQSGDFRAHALAEIAEAEHRAGLVSQSRTRLDEALGVARAAPRIRGYVAVARAYARCGRADTAREVCNEALKSDQLARIRSATPSPILMGFELGELWQTQAEAGDFEGALRTASLGDSTGGPPDEIAVEMVRAGEYQKAIELKASEEEVRFEILLDLVSHPTRISAAIGNSAVPAVKRFLFGDSAHALPSTTTQAELLDRLKAASPAWYSARLKLLDEGDTLCTGLLQVEGMTYRMQQTRALGTLLSYGDSDQRLDMIGIFGRREGSVRIEVTSQGPKYDEAVMKRLLSYAEQFDNVIRSN